MIYTNPMAICLPIICCNRYILYICPGKHCVANCVIYFMVSINDKWPLDVPHSTYRDNLPLYMLYQSMVAQINQLCYLQNYLNVSYHILIGWYPHTVHKLSNNQPQEYYTYRRLSLNGLVFKGTRYMFFFYSHMNQWIGPMQYFNQ